MNILQISEQTIKINDIDTEFSLDVKNISSHNVMVKFILSNPQQYKLSVPYVLLQPNQIIHLKIGIKFCGINDFNYKNNSLTIMYSKPDINTKITIKNFEIGKNNQSIYTKKLYIEIDVQLPSLSVQVYNKIKNNIKIIQISSFSSVVLKHSPFLQQLASSFGKISSIMRHESMIIVTYEETIKIIPDIVINSNKNGIIESVYSYSYPTLQELTFLEQSKGLIFNKVDQIFIPSVVKNFTVHDQILACNDDTTIYFIHLNNKQVKQFNHTAFKISSYPPFLCAVMQYKYLIFYENWSQPKAINVKLKKLQIKCFCKVNNNLFAGGKNRSKLSFKQTTNRRQIMVYENFKVQDVQLKPSKKIRIDDSNEDINMLLFQSPYIFCYCQPNIYLINSQKFQVMIKLQRNLQSGLLLEGRYLKSLISFVGITAQDRLIRINFDRMGVVYGVQIDQTAHKAFSIAQTKSGRVFVNQHNAINQFNPVMTQITNQWKPKQQQSGVFRCIQTNLKNQLLILKNQQKTSLLQFYTFD